MRSRFSIILLALLLFTSYFSTPAQAELSEASHASALASGLVLIGSIHTLTTGSRWLVHSVKTIGPKAEVVLRNTANASSVVLETSARGLGIFSVAAGKSIEVLSTNAGKVLVYSGQLLAFIPNELGNVLLHQSSYP